MVDDINLDSLITASNSDDELTSTQALSPQTMQRPKLRKIKRPKIRPQIDVPQAPAKVEPLVDTEAITDRGQENPDLNEAHTEASTSLITAKDINNIVREDAQSNSYVLDGLPPDLDFDGDYSSQFDESAYIKKNIVYSIATVCLVIGVFLGFVIAPKESEQHGLEGVIWNPDTPKGRVRCGRTEPSQACTFYILNSYKRELNGRDFYKLAAKMTGREEFMIETENMQYSTTKIKPGYFAQLNIPALK